MRKIIVTEFVTLDGVMEAPNEWSFPYWNDDIAKFKYDELFASDALLLGRVTYDGFAAAWPSQKDEQGFADRMNSMKKYVVSNTRELPSWNNTMFIKGDVVEEIKRLKESEGGNILIAGSAQLIHSLREYNLIDEYQLLVYPVLLGEGKKLFKDGFTNRLKLLECRSFDSGVALLRYQIDQ